MSLEDFLVYLCSRLRLNGNIMGKDRKRKIILLWENLIIL